MRFARGYMRDHIVSHKSDHGASYRRYGVLSWRSWLKINFCEISTSLFVPFVALHILDVLDQDGFVRLVEVEMGLQ